MIFEKCMELSKNNTSFVMITMSAIKGSAPQNLGAKCIVTSNGLSYGTIGGGKIEAAVINKAISMIIQEVNMLQTVTWNLQKDIGMTCGGEATFIFEPFLANHWPVVIFGAGHVAQALTRTLSPLNCQITCIDNRKEWLDKLEANVKAIYAENIASVVASLNPKSYFISMTQGHSHDVPILYEIYKKFPLCQYVGVIGSKTKGLQIKKELKQMDVSEEFINKLIIPIGLPIGDNSPEQISISIAAQLLEVRSK